MFTLRAFYLVSAIVMPSIGIHRSDYHWANLVSLWVNCAIEIFQFVLIVLLFRETAEEPYDDYAENQDEEEEEVN